MTQNMTNSKTATSMSQQVNGKKDEEKELQIQDDVSLEDVDKDYSDI